MSHLPDSDLPSTRGDDKEFVPVPHRALNMPSLEEQPEPASSGYPAMELYEMEGYVLQSLELLATTPINQYYGPENTYSELEPWLRSANRSPQSDAVPLSLLTAVPTPRYDPWDGRSSFQQVHQRAIEPQELQQQNDPCFTLPSSSGSQSPGALVPIYTQSNHYHSNTMPQYHSSLGSTGSQPQVEEPTLKRKRNTAASARFRAKKKRQEQLLAQTARENEATLNRLENRVVELETENRWLKNLLIDKNEVTTRNEAKAITGERKGYEHKDGVGTSSQ